MKDQDPQVRFPSDGSGSPTGQAIVEAVAERVLSGVPTTEDSDCIIVVFGDEGEFEAVIDPGSGVFDHEPPRSWTQDDQRLHEAMLAGHLDLSTCVDVNGPKIWEPSTFTGPMLPPGPLKLIEHHCPPDNGDK